MFERTKQKLYEKQVVDLIKIELFSLLGRSRGKECLGMFAMAILKSQEYGEMPSDLLERFKANGFTKTESAWAYLDASITACKSVLERAGGSSPDIDSIVADMERAVDLMYLAHPSGKIIPRNGNIAKSMTDIFQ